MHSKIRDFNSLVTNSMRCSVISSSAIFACIFLGENEKVNTALRIVFPTVFWLGFAAEQFCIWKANYIRKQLEFSIGKPRAKMKIGAISFLQTDSGMIADIVMVVSLVVLMILTAFDVGERATQYIFIFLLVLSFRLHCILNGKNFRYKKILAKRKVDKNE